jgi:hypothetical protein
MNSSKLVSFLNERTAATPEVDAAVVAAVAWNVVATSDLAALDHAENERADASKHHQQAVKEREQNARVVSVNLVVVSSVDHAREAPREKERLAVTAVAAIAQTWHVSARAT